MFSDTKKPSRAVRFALTCSAVVVVGLTIAAVRPAEVVPGLSFKISASTRIYPGDTPRGQDDEVMRGKGVAAGNKARIEFLAYTPAPQGITTDDYVIAVDSGKAFVLHTNGNRYTTASDLFGGPGVVALSRVSGVGRGGRGGGGGPPPGGGGGGAGRGGRGGGGGGPPGGIGGAGRAGRGRGRGGVGSGFLSQIELLDVNFKVEKLGAGDSLDNRPTQRYRITTDYKIAWGDQVLPAHAVTDVWTAALPTDIPNPFEPLIVADQSTDGPLVEYALKLRAVRAQFEGTPIKVITNTTLTGIHDIVGFQSYVAGDPTLDTLHIVQQTQITGIQPANVDTKLFFVPDDVSNPGAP